MLLSFIRTRIMPLLARLSNHLPGWVYWQLLWRANHKFLIGAVAVILDERGDVLLFRHTFRPSGYEWGLPGGWMKHGESIEQGLEREVYEESRLKVKMLSILSASPARRVPRLDVVFLGCPQGGTFQPSNEVSEAKFFPVSDLPRMIPDQQRAIQAALRQKAAQQPARQGRPV